MRKLVVAVVLVAAVAVAQTIVKADQGKPGTQGPWPVTLSGSIPVVIVDGGVSGGGGTATSTDAGVSVTVPYCSVSRSSIVSVGTSASTVPVDGGLAGRWMVRVCNSIRNTGIPTVTCATGGVTPDAGLLGDGESLQPGDCAVYTTGGAVSCISDTAATAVSTWECR